LESTGINIIFQRAIECSNMPGEGAGSAGAGSAGPARPVWLGRSGSAGLARPVCFGRSGSAGPARPVRLGRSGSAGCIVYLVLPM